MLMSDRIANTRCLGQRSTYGNDRMVRYLDLGRARWVYVYELCRNANVRARGSRQVEWKYHSTGSHVEYLGWGVKATKDVQCSPCSVMDVNKMPS
jgi:hypothetical protein